MKNPFHVESKADKQYRQDLQRWKAMATMTGPTDQTILSTQPKEVIERVGPRIEAEFQVKAARAGELFPIEEKDHAGRDVTRYYGDIKAAFRESLIPAVPIRLSKVIHFQGRPYLEGQIPPSVQREMALAKIGRDWA